MCGCALGKNRPLVGAFSGIGTVIIRRLNISRTRIAVSSAFVSSLNTSSLSVIRLVVTFRRRFGIRVPSSITRGVGAIGSAMRCVSSTGWTMGLAVRPGKEPDNLPANFVCEEV